MGRNGGSEQRLEENGLYEASSDHWELLEDIHFRTSPSQSGIVCIPKDICRHLGLEYGDKLTIAIHHLVKRNKKILELKPVNLALKKMVRRRSSNTSKIIIESFLACNLKEVEVSLKDYHNLSMFLWHHKEYPVLVHRVNVYAWLEKKIEK